MKSITIDEILNFNPCEKYTREVLESIFDGRKSMNLFDIACENDVLEDDRLWLLVRMVPDRLKHVFACDCAERALLRERDEGREPDNRLWEAIRTKRLWIDGHATDEQLLDAHSAAADAASASSSASASAAYAYSSAAAASASAAARAVYAAANASAADAAAAYAAHAADADADADAAHAASYASADAAAHSAAADAAYTAYVEAYAATRKQERNWQIDRLINLAIAIKHDA